MTPDLNKDIQYHVWSYLEITGSDILVKADD